MTKLSKHFDSDEFSCPCCGKNKVAGELVAKLQQLRDIINKPIHITSGYRCKAYNKKIGGYSKSPHLDGLAVDCNVKSWVPIDFAIMATKIRDIRIGIYPNHIHIDIMPSSPSKYWLVKKYGKKPIYSKREKDLAKFLKDKM